MDDELQATRADAPLFSWDERRDRAAHLLAAGEMGINQIAAAVGVDRDTLWNWRKSPMFTARVSNILEAYRDAMMKTGINQKVERLLSLRDRHSRLTRVIEERAAAALTDPEAAEVPGAASGLMVRQVRVVGSGRAAERVVEWAVDTATLREMRSIEEHISREMGQWAPSAPVAVNMKMYVGIDIDRV